MFKTVWPILLKFCTIKHISLAELISCSKNQTFKNPRWRTAANLKNVKCDISAAIRPILMKFGMMVHLTPLKLMETKNLQV